MRPSRQQAGHPGRLLFFDAYPHVVGGAQRTTLMLAAAMRDRGWSVSVATPGPGPFVDRIGQAGIAHTVLPLPPALLRYGHRTTGWRGAAAVAALPRSWLRTSVHLRGRFDVVHTVDHRGQLLVGPPARLAGIPVVWHVHNVEPGWAVNRLCRRFADRTVAPDASLGRTLFPWDPGSMCEVPNGLPDEVLQWAGRAAPPAAPRIVSVGRMDPQKGYETLMHVVRLLRDQGHEITAEIAGGTAQGLGDYAEHLLALRTRLGLEDAVGFVGAVDDVGSFLGRGGVYVQTSRWEVQPLAVMEAMAAGLPVVATGVGAVGSLLAGGERGWVVRPGDVRATAECVVAALAGGAEVARRVRAARRHIVEAARPERMADRMEAVYRSL